MCSDYAGYLVAVVMSVSDKHAEDMKHDISASRLLINDSLMHVMCFPQPLGVVVVDEVGKGT